MCAKRVRAKEVYDSDDVIIGYGEVPAIHTSHGLQWILPNRELTACRDTAVRWAQQIDRLIQSNMKRYDRSLIF